MTSNASLVTPASGVRGARLERISWKKTTWRHRPAQYLRQPQNEMNYKYVASTGGVPLGVGVLLRGDLSEDGAIHAEPFRGAVLRLKIYNKWGGGWRAVLRRRAAVWAGRGVYVNRDKLQSRYTNARETRNDNHNRNGSGTSKQATTTPPPTTTGSPTTTTPHLNVETSDETRPTSRTMT